MKRILQLINFPSFTTFQAIAMQVSEDKDPEQPWQSAQATSQSDFSLLLQLSPELQKIVLTSYKCIVYRKYMGGVCRSLERLRQELDIIIINFEDMSDLRECLATFPFKHVKLSFDPSLEELKEISDKNFWAIYLDKATVKDISTLSNFHTLSLVKCWGARDLLALGKLSALNLTSCCEATDVFALGGARTLRLVGQGIKDIPHLSSVRNPNHLTDFLGHHRKVTKWS